LELRKTFSSKKLIELLSREEYIPIQLLILHYLDLLESFGKSNIKTSILLSVLLKTEGKENIRKGLSNIHRFKTAENLDHLREIFEATDLELPLAKVNKDIKKLSAKIK
jgi:hypothetical protein